MDSEVNLYMLRAENKLLFAKITFDISTSNSIKDAANVPRGKTFFNEVISESYYSIFYTAKAYLLSKNIKTFPPEEHKKTYEEFKRLVDLKILQRELLSIYDEEIIKAEALTEIFKTEKKKRGNFVYNIKSEANIPFAQESINNSKKFVSIIKNLIEK